MTRVAITGIGITSPLGRGRDETIDAIFRNGALNGRQASVGTTGDRNAARPILFGAAAANIPVSSTKSMHGHAMGASGSIEIAASLLALNDGFIAPTINLENPDPACDLDYVPNAARESRAEVFLSNSFGFGGMNAVVAIRTVNGNRFAL